VRAIYAWYLKHRALGPVARELRRRGWRTQAASRPRRRTCSLTNRSNAAAGTAFAGQVRSPAGQR
jgi:hypothetical protein